jgi:hypothetical protein
MSESNKKGPGRPRLQEKPCTHCLGLPMTEDDWDRLTQLAQRFANRAGKKISKQEVVRIIIRKHLESEHE